MTGFDGDFIERCAERICNQQRAIQLREGRKVPEDDFPQEFNFTEPLPPMGNGQRIMVPGPGEETVDATGNTLDIDKFTGMLKEYYRLRGWDEESGFPRKQTLTELDLDDLIPNFQKPSQQ